MAALQLGRSVSNPNYYFYPIGFRQSRSNSNLGIVWGLFNGVGVRGNSAYI